MLPGLPSLVAPSTDVRIRPSPLFPGKGRYRSASAQELTVRAATLLGAWRSWDLMLGLELGVRNLLAGVPLFDVPLPSLRRPL